MRLRRRGILFISVLLLTVLVAMFVGASAELGTWGLRRAVSQADVAAAHRAARSGVEYALARLRADPLWKAAGPRQITVNEPYLQVVEEEGNVVGLLRSGAQTSQFRIRFNWSDGSGGGDGLNDLSNDMNLNSLGYLSLNNLSQVSDANVPSATSGTANPGSPHTTIPGYAVQLVVEGRCGDILQSATATSPNPAVAGLALASTRIETCYKVMNPVSGGPPSAAASAGAFSAKVGNKSSKDTLELDSADNTVTGRLRSRSTMAISGGHATSPNLTAKKSGEYRALSGFTGSPSAKVTGATEAAADGLPVMTWAQVQKATTNNLAAGTYVFFDDGSLHYYDMTSAEYRTYMSNPANHGDLGTTITDSALPPSLELTNSKLEVLDSTLVVPSATGKKDLAILPRKGAAAGPGAPAASSVSTTNQSSMWTSINSVDSSLLTKSGSNWVFKGALADFVSAAAVNYGISTSSYTLPGGSVFNNLGSSNVNFDNVNALGQGIVSLALWNFYQSNPTSVQFTTLASAATGEDLSTSIPGAPGTKTPRDIEVEFKPGTGSAVLTVPGNATIGANLKGKGGSITAEGNVNLVGLGVDFSALSNPTEGVSIYSKKDILISGYNETNGKYHDVNLKGVVYCWGDFCGLLGNSSLSNTDDWGKFSLTGTLIAYGKDPSAIGAATKGKVDLIAEEAKLKYDPSYIGTLTGSLPANVELGRVRWLQL